MKPESWREDGWPLCPVCGEDELADLTPALDRVDAGADRNHDLYCYRFQRVTVKAGEGEMPSATETK